MMKSAAFLIVLGMSAPALAADSTWLVCKGVAEHGKDKDKMYIVVSALEHRGAKDGRDVSVTLLKGARVATGDLKGTQKGKLKLIDSRKKTLFTGDAELSEDFKTFSLSGTFDEMFGDAKPMNEPFTAKLACEQLDDLAIGK